MADYGVKITLAALSPIPNYTGGIWTNGSAWLCSGEAPTVDWINGALVSVSAIGERVDVARGGNYAETSDATVTIESTHWKAFDAAGASIYGASVVVGQLADDGTFSSRWSGVVREPEWAGAVLTLSVESVNTLRHREIPARIITATEFPNLPTSSEGACVPIIYGACERMRPPVLESGEIPLIGQKIWSSSSAVVDSDCTALQSLDFSGEEKNYSIIYRIAVSGSWGSKTGTWAESISDSSAIIYMRILSGTGSGQTRRVFFYANSSGVTFGANTIYGVAVTVDTPLDTDPDYTSEIEFYRVDRLARICVSDELGRAECFAESDGVSSPISSSQTVIDGLSIVDLSSEFGTGEAVESIQKVTPYSVGGRSELVDGISTSGKTRKFSERGVTSIGVDYDHHIDLACYGKAVYQQLMSTGAKKLYLLLSFDGSAGSDSYEEYFPQVWGTDFRGNVHQISLGVGGTFKIQNEEANAFSPTTSVDGERGGFQRYAYEIPLDAPICSYESLEFGVMLARDSGGGSERVFRWLSVVFDGTAKLIAPYEAIADIVGAYIRIAATTISGPGAPGCYLAINGDTYYHKSGDWAQISSVVRSIENPAVMEVYLSTIPSWPIGSYAAVLSLASPTSVFDLVEREVALALSFGEVSLGGGILVSCDSGRSYDLAHWPSIPPGEVDGNRITVAKHAATDIMYRDLGLVTGDVDQSSFDALDSSAITALIYERESSRDILAQIAEEFGWIFAHDLQGRERAAKFMERIGSTSYDYDVTTADMIRETVTGLQATAIEDVVTLPTFLGDWTQTDGYRLSYGVSDLGIPPDALDSGNFRQYVFGYWDELTADTRSFYRKFYEGIQISGVRQAGEIPIRFHLGNAGYDMMLARSSWISRRKPIIEFSILETSAKAAALVGDRMRVTHRRYLQAGAIGTVVARYWNPEAGSVQYTVMLDPAPIVGGEAEGGWNFNFGNDWGELTP